MAGLTEDLHDEAAERYARAAFDLALETQGVDALGEDLAAMAAALAESAELREAARSPLIEVEDKVRAFVAVAAHLNASELGRKLVGLLAQNGRAKELPAVARAYAALLARYRGQRQVEIITPAPLEPAAREALLAALKAALGAEIQPVDKIDPSLLGGFIVRAGSRQYDASLRSKLDQLALALHTA